MCNKRLTLCVFLQTECGRTAMQQLTMREAMLKRWIVQGGLHLATIPQGIQARAVAHSPPGMEPLSSKLHLKRSISGQVFAQFICLSLESSPGGGHEGRCLWVVLKSSGKVILESAVCLF